MMRIFILLIFSIILNVANSFSEENTNHYYLNAVHLYLDESDKNSEHVFFNLIKIPQKDQCVGMADFAKKRYGIKQDSPGVVIKCIDGDQIIDTDKKITVDERFLPMFNLQPSNYFYLYFLDSMGNKTIITNIIEKQSLSKNELNRLLELYKKSGLKDLYIQNPK